MAHLSACLDTRKVSRGQMERRDRRRRLWIDAYSLHEACKAFGRTQVQVAKAIGVSQNRVSHMESGDMGATGIDSLRRYIAVLGGSLTLDVRLPSGDIKFAEGMRTQAQWCDPTAALDPPHVRPYRRATSQHAGATVCHKGHVSVRTMCVSALSRYTRSSLTLNPCRSQNRFPPSFLPKATKATLLILSARSALSEASTSCVPMFR